ncbi:CRISPR-associated endoribonuclease Cas6 [Carboxydocella sp. JDF658]|uniref:CRISPR-associated endoribonuclease Cas6 n=1 Tax=Carboxydocella sp. JDF658 TaxID=1926600 RepID=UPI0009AEC02D|nr:CRISPR-associated endoribonuclease Cas6 [Carboxydocella sp. JDF658]AVX29685.1 CRISPR-associated protein, Cas6 family [Carboxydocella thermautotrophica]GAW30340.1 CRISPR-associated endoribonuclease Cas6 [Carboxydocella sp. JDF658]
MRLDIILKTKDKEVLLPFNYQYQITSFIYEMVAKSSPDYATKLHDEGFGEKRFKFFTFSQIVARKKKIVSDGVWLFGEFVLKISSPLYDFLFHLLNGLYKQNNIKIGREIFLIKDILLYENPVIKSGMNFVCLSPIVVSTIKDDFSTPYYIRYTEEPELFNEKLRQNLIRKYQTYYGRAPAADNLQIVFDQEYLQRHKGTKLIHYRDQKILGYLAPFTIYGSDELITFGYDTGFGEKNSMGFGFVELRKR